MEPDGVHATFLIGRTKREAEWGVAKKVLEKLFERERQRVLSRGGGWAHGEGRGKGRRRGRCLLRCCCGRTRAAAASTPWTRTKQWRKLKALSISINEVSFRFVFKG